jgi:hypothetical protein
VTINITELWLNDIGFQFLLEIEKIIRDTNIVLYSKICVIKYGRNFYLCYGRPWNDS